MAKDEQKPMTRAELLAIIEQARRENWEELDLRSKGITELPPEIGQLKKLKKLDLGNEWNTPDELKLDKRLCPEGTCDNSPPIYWWEKSPKFYSSPARDE